MPQCVEVGVQGTVAAVDDVGNTLGGGLWVGTLGYATFLTVGMLLGLLVGSLLFRRPPGG